MVRSTSAGRLCTPSRRFLGVHSGLAIAYQTWPFTESNGPGASTVTVTSYRCFGCGFNSGCAGSPCAMEHPVIKARVKRSATTAAVLGAMVQSLRSDWVSRASSSSPRAHSSRVSIPACHSEQTGRSRRLRRLLPARVERLARHQIHSGRDNSTSTHAMNALIGNVRIHDHTMRSTTVQRTALKRLDAPTPMIADDTTCVVETGRPKIDDTMITNAELVSAANPLIGCSFTILWPSVLMMRQPPPAVPAAITSAHSTFTHTGIGKCPPVSVTRRKCNHTGR